MSFEALRMHAARQAGVSGHAQVCGITADVDTEPAALPDVDERKLSEHTRPRGLIENERGVKQGGEERESRDDVPNSRCKLYASILSNDFQFLIAEHPWQKPKGPPRCAEGASLLKVNPCMSVRDLSKLRI